MPQAAPLLGRLQKRYMGNLYRRKVKKWVVRVYVFIALSPIMILKCANLGVLCPLNVRKRVTLLKLVRLKQRKITVYRVAMVNKILQKQISVFKKPPPIPFAFKEKVIAELKRLEQEGVIEKVQNSIWSTPLVLVTKADRVTNTRVCANYKVTINKYLQNFNYPLPRIEEIFAALQGGQLFTKLDFLNAYNQLEVDEETAELLAWSTPYGIYKVKRLLYGTKPACSLFQAVVEKVLQGCRVLLTIWMTLLLLVGMNRNIQIIYVKF